MLEKTLCPRCLFDDTIAVIGQKQCNYCDIHDQLEHNSNPDDLIPALRKVSRAGKGKKYDCLIGISGGLDSSTLLYTAVKVWRLRPLVIHFDNNWNNEAAESNMKNLISKLGVDCIIYKVNKEEYDTLNEAFLLAGVPDADIPNDVAMTKLMYDTADKYGIKYILNGHDFREEGSTPAKWTYMDARYIRSVYRTFAHKELTNYPLFTFWDQIVYGFKGIKQIRPFHYGFNRKELEDNMKAFISWKDYGSKHCENIYTEFVGSYLLPTKFGIDKRIVYLSAKVRSGILTREEALDKLSKPVSFDLEKLGSTKTSILLSSTSPIGDRANYDKYNFKRWKFVIWFLAKANVVPWTFYKKYC